MKKPHYRKDEAGSTVVMALFTTLILGGFVALAVDYTGNIGRNAQRDRVFNHAVEIGDGCLELAFASWRKVSAISENPATQAFDAIPTPSPGDFPSFPGAVITNFDVQAVDPMITLASDNPPVSALPAASPPTKTTGPGTGTFSYFYLATVDVSLPYQRGSLKAKVRRVFEKRYTSAWNWAMLYNDDLELHPDSPLTLTGWVHSNKSVFVGNGSLSGSPPPDATLTLKDRLTYAGNYLNGFSPLDKAHTGQTNVTAPISPEDLPPGSEQTYAPFGWNPSQFSPGGGNNNDDGYREMIERKSQTGANGDPFKDQRLYNQANIAITIDDSNTIKVYTGITTGSNENKTLVTSSSGTGLSADAYSAAGNAVKPGYYIQDNREQQTGGVRVVDFDVAEFIKKFPRSYPTTGSPSSQWNGIVYISDISSSATQKRGIRIKNGGTVPTGGITIVSDNPVYIQGDFNTGRVAGLAEPPSNTGNPDDPDAGTYKRQPASIMADAVTLLSNNWQDGNASKPVAERVATNTTVNAALIAGNVPSDGTTNSYSGGGENFVRLLEDWTDKTFTYYGSMVNLYKSEIAKGRWDTALGGNVYKSPQLKWFFDSTLSVDASGEPVKVPGHVSTVAYLQQQRWYLQYD